MTKFCMMSPRRAIAVAIAFATAGGCTAEPSPGDGPVSSAEQRLVVGDGGPASSQPLAAGAAGSGAGVTEATRIQGELDAQYAPRDVQHTFESYFGELIDCVDYYAQPGATALKAQGRAVPKPESNGLDARSRSALPDFMFNGKPDRFGRERACPAGTVPIVHVSVDDVLARGGLDEAKKAHRYKAPPPRESGLDPCVGDAQAGHAHVVQGFTGGTSITSDISRMAIYAPAVTTNSKFSLSQTWSYTGSGFNICGETCTTDCSQTVEAGWVVYPGIFPNNNPGSPHLFTFATGDGYAHGCWNQDPMTGSCLTFMTSPGALLSPGATLPASVRGQTPVELQIQMVHGTNGWCLTAGVLPNVSEIGCWPSSDFTGNLATAASNFQVGGEIASGTSIDNFIPMGSGVGGGYGFRQAAYHRDYFANGLSTFTPLRFLDHFSYGMALKPAAGGSWGNWFYFGPEPITGWAGAHDLLLLN